MEINHLLRSLLSDSNPVMIQTLAVNNVDFHLAYTEHQTVERYIFSAQLQANIDVLRCFERSCIQFKGCVQFINFNIKGPGF